MKLFARLGGNNGREILLSLTPKDQYEPFFLGTIEVEQPKKMVKKSFPLSTGFDGYFSTDEGIRRIPINAKNIRLEYEIEEGSNEE